MRTERLKQVLQELAAGDAIAALPADGFERVYAPKLPPIAATGQTQEAKAYARGVREGRLLADEEHMAVLQMRENEMRARLNEASRAQNELSLQDLVQALVRQIDAAEGRLADKIATILEPLVARAICERTMEQLVSDIRTALSGQRATKVRISAPLEFHELLSRQLGRLQIVHALAVASEPVIEVTVDDTLILANLRDWLKPLETASNE